MFSLSPRTPDDITISALIDSNSSKPSESFLREIVDLHLKDALRKLPATGSTPLEFFEASAAVFNQLQNMTASVISALITDAAIEGILREGMESELTMSGGANVNDLTHWDNVLKSHIALKKMLESFRENMEQVNQMWTNVINNRVSVKQEPMMFPTYSPRSSVSRSSRTSSHPDVAFGHSGSTPHDLPSPDTRPFSKQSPSSPPGQDDMTHETDAMEIDLQSLKNRGKGAYRCTYGTKCDKGGCNNDGTLVVFERNCMFRQHMDKHQKPFRCSLAGCTNKDGFARKDQLERHQKNVFHTPGSREEQYDGFSLRIKMHKSTPSAMHASTIKEKTEDGLPSPMRQPARP